MDADRLRIDVWSDVVCPWCFLGKRRLEAAVESLAWREDVEIRWRAYRLDPRATREPGDLRAVLERKYGPGALEGMVRRMVPLGEEVGIAYRFDRVQRVSSWDAHRLLAWAWTSGGAVPQGSLQDSLFRAYFEEGVNVADPTTLVRLAGEAGLDADEAETVVGSDAFADEVAADLREADERDIIGVPAFLIGGRFMVPGAQDVETFRLVLERARAQAGAGNISR